MEKEKTIHNKPYCRYCEKQLYGRAGKIFCNVDCKNNYNSHLRSVQRSTENELFPKVITAIKKTIGYYFNTTSGKKPKQEC